MSRNLSIGRRRGRESTGAARRREAEAGFTLVELLVVLAILALVAAVAAPQVLKYLGKAKSETAKVQLAHLGSALELYFLDTGRYPSSREGLAALVAPPAGAKRWAGPYLKKADGLVDPWGQPYRYRQPGQHAEVDVFSLGRDGQPGGEGEDRDLTSW